MKKSLATRTKKTIKRIAPRAYRRISGLFGPSNLTLDKVADRIASNLFNKTIDLFAGKKLSASERANLRAELDQLQFSMIEDYAIFASAKAVMDAFGIRKNRQEVFELFYKLSGRIDNKVQAQTMDHKLIARDRTIVVYSASLDAIFGLNASRAAALFNRKSYRIIQELDVKVPKYYSYRAGIMNKILSGEFKP